MTRYTYACTLSFGVDGEPTYSEVEAEFSYTVSPGSPETGRFGPPEDYDPGSPAVVEDVRLEKVEGKPRPWDMGYGFIPDDEFATDCEEKVGGSDHHLEAMLREAAEADEARRPD